ncbi:hypothetical protein DFH07DRAFT_771445 [Mycena maculata]|uniref:Fungal-type protein kinase domain-containing protein n=1 Tax=Mycena maculata TaxID=230809 RepID=A0AAD7NIN0_9AGAR|nr:hypothetical protein DFH07DRAFT_771445 [Mycena maculata]
MNEAATELMYNDPRRRYVIGFTIEDEQMPLCQWYLVVVMSASDEFNFQTGAKIFMRFFLTILRRSPNSGMTLPSPAASTSLSEDAAYRLVSRATVKKMIISNTGEWTKELEDEVYVLKDVWLYDNARLESHIRADIFDALRAKD